MTVAHFISAAVAVFLVSLATAAPVSAARQSPPSPFQLLDVPYVQQSEDLCGGAAAAMVMRYWGATGVYAETFAHLVDREAGGIRGQDLIDALRALGWSAASYAGDRPSLQSTLEQRRPPIALIEDRPGRFHYVVVVGWTDRTVVLHDPARAPFKVLSEEEFIRAWSRSGYWTLTVLPDDGRTTSDARDRGTSGMAVPADGPCGAMVERGVALANSGELDAAHQLLELATRTCAAEVAAWRELAGIHALRKDWRAAAAVARRALHVDPRDEHAARILAASLYLEGDTAGALSAWNLLGEPLIDLVQIRGLERTRFAVGTRALGLAPQSLLTPARLLRAARRLDALPAFAGTRVSYIPGGRGLTRVTAAVIERPMLPTVPLAIATTALGAAIDRELRLEAASLTGGGESWRAGWRWWEARPRIAVGFRAPAPFGGIWEVEGSHEEETYGAGPDRFRHGRRRAAFGVSDWVTGTLAWSAAVALERWPAGTVAGFTGSLHYQSTSDRLAVRAGTGLWGGSTSTWRASSSIEWRSRASHEGTVWSAAAGGETTGADAPLFLLPGAGAGQGRPQLLRAHRLLHQGAIRDAVFGRALVHGTAEWRRWSRPVRRVFRAAPAAFVDVARAYRTPAFGDPRTHMDVGVGLRLAVPGAGVVRADLARGLRDGRTALSVGWTR